MTLPLSHQEIAALLHVPLEDVDAAWPRLEACLDALGCGSVNSKVGALATVSVETANTFRPIHEFGSDVLHEREYGGRKDLGNLHPGDGAKFAGRGFIQVTGEVNYRAYGRQLGIDLEANPELADTIDVAACIFAAYWRDHDCHRCADVENWVEVRRRVNGGHNGLEKFLRYVDALQAAIKVKTAANVCTAGVAP